MTKSSQQPTHPDTVRVSSPARIHLGFLDLNGSTGRKFGSIGLAIDDFRTHIEVSRSAELAILGENLTDSLANKTRSLITLFYDTIGSDVADEDKAVTVTFNQFIPEHSGLGSGTQLALCLGTALCKLHDIVISTAELAAALGRGNRSGIGITTFDHGGFVVDGGRGADSEYPALLAQYDYPEEWRIILIMDPMHQGVHGQKELKAFKELPPFPITQAQSISHITLMKLLPSLVEQTIQSFGEAITDIQQLIGDHFAPAQGGRYTSQHVAELLSYSQGLGHSGIAQSSWGPTGCVFVSGQAEAETLVKQLQQHAKDCFGADHQLFISITKANKDGANIDIIQ